MPYKKATEENEPNLQNWLLSTAPFVPLGHAHHPAVGVFNLSILNPHNVLVEFLR